MLYNCGLYDSFNTKIPVPWNYIAIGTQVNLILAFWYELIFKKV